VKLVSENLLILSRLAYQLSLTFTKQQLVIGFDQLIDTERSGDTSLLISTCKLLTEGSNADTTAGKISASKTQNSAQDHRWAASPR